MTETDKEFLTIMKGLVSNGNIHD